MDRFTQIALVVWWGLGKTGLVEAAPTPVATAQPDLVPVYELRRQRHDLSLKTGHWHVIT
ncbi:hypothetical protein ACVDG5_012935 [Mesorhizobium sp. ORM6]